MGSAKVVVSFEAWKDGGVVTTEQKLPVVALPAGLRREAISSRLRQTLVHPDKEGVLVGLQYSADGRRLLAGHYLSGVVQVWDARSGQQLTRLETGQRRSIGVSSYLQLAPDGVTLYDNRGHTEEARIIAGKEKRLIHVVFAGGVRAWDLDRGQARHDFQPAVERGISTMELSPDGSTLFTAERLSGDYEHVFPASGTFWDAKSGRQRGSLSERIALHAAFSADGKTLATFAMNEKNKSTALLFFDASTGKVRRSFALEQKDLGAVACAFSPQGEILAGVMTKLDPAECYLKCWDVATGRELICIKNKSKSLISPPVFSPDGRLLAVMNLDSKRELLLIDVPKRKLIKTTPLAEGSARYALIFSPDGKWLATIAQAVPINVNPIRKKPDELPQPRILLIKTATGEIRETIIAPPALAVSLCFSPDGKTLASGSDGRVLLWDMTTPPGKQK